jgi:hypothetical protein
MALWTPNDEAGLLGWWEMSDPNYYDTSTKVWTKRWGTLNNFTAPGDGPSKTAVGFDGTKSCLVFQGASDTGLWIDNPGFTEFVFVIAYRFTATPSAAVNLMNREDGSGARYTPFDFGGVQVNYADQSQNYFDGGAWPNTVISVSRHSANSRILRWNGEQQISDTTAATGSPSSTTDLCLARYAGGTPTYNVQIAAVGIFTNASWSTDLAEKVEGYIAHSDSGLGATTAQLPSGHPYKTEAPEGPLVDADAEAVQTLADFGQTATASTVGAAVVSQTLEDFGQTAALSPNHTLISNQTLEDFLQVATLSVDAIALNALVEQELENFGQGAFLQNVVPSVMSLLTPTITCGPGQYGTPISTAPNKMRAEGRKRWPTR